MAVPLDLPGARRDDPVRTRTRFEEPPVVARLALDVNGVEVGRFKAGVPDASTAVITIPAAATRHVVSSRLQSDRAFAASA